MKRTKHFQTRLRQHALYHVGIWMCVIWVQWIPIDSALADAAAGVLVVEDKVTLPSRNEATNPLKEPTPSTLQGAFLSGNLTDANNGSTNTPPADAPKRDGQASVTSTTAATGIAETVLNVRTAVPATLPVDRPNGSATKPDLATTNRPLESWENVVHTSTERPPVQQQPSESSAKPSTGGPTVSGGIYGPDSNNKDLMDNMLKSWFNHEDDSTAAAKVYYKLADEYLENNVGDGGRGEDDGTSDAVSSSSKAATVAVTAGSNNKSLFERWDEASEEQERVLEDAMRSERPVIDGGSPPTPSSSSVLAADQNTPSRWFVLLLSGNSTVAQMRRTDFAKYLKLNLAARLSLEYDEVKINRVLVVPPRLMVNVSVVPVTERASAAAAAAAAATAAASSSSSFLSFSRSSSTSDAVVSDRVVEDDDPLHNLVETNATLMELSGEEYRVERFMSLKSQKPQSMEETAAVVSDRHADIDSFIYATVGPLCFVVLLGFLSFTLYKYVRQHPVQWPWKRKLRHPSFWPGGGDRRHRRMTDECGDGGGTVDGGDYGASSADGTPGAFGRVGGGGNGSAVNVIYSGEFEQSQQQQLSGSWLDDASFVPDDSLDRIRTPTLLRTAAPDKSKTFADMLQQCGDGGSRPNERHYGRSPRDGQYAAAAVHAHSPRLGRDNKLRILGCKQSCLLLPAVQPDVVVDDGSMHVTTTPVCSDDGGQRA